MSALKPEIVEKIKKRLNEGIRPTQTVAGLLKKADIILAK